MKSYLKKSALLILLFTAVASIANQLPKEFTYLREMIPNIILEMRYSSANNFTGRIVDGYFAPKAILTIEAATKLKEIQDEIEKLGLTIKIFDAYRPQQSVNCFVRWANSPEDFKTKSTYYPNEEKINLFKHGYISPKSAHSRGSSIDLTLASIDSNKHVKPLDMGSSFDRFGEESRSDYKGVTAQQKANRLLLKLLMEKHGFEPYPFEWWHFRLKEEPFPDTYFDFPVK